MLKMYLYLLLIFAIPVFAEDENVLLTEVFTIALDPLLFNWTYEGDPTQYVYQASLLDSPDLPSWIKYVFSDKHKMGFLYGVPPNRNIHKIPLQVVALNTKNYDTKIKYINIHISEKLNPAKYEVTMKIDNINVEDIFDAEKMDSLRDVFRKNLWKDSENDLYVTYLESAIELGARKPLDPGQGEGIVLRLGSQSPFSNNLKELEEEVRPLWKLPSCPRNFKRTSVERFFRDAGFALDWCAFRLIDPNNSAMHHSGEKDNGISKDKWVTITKDDIPTRNYSVDVTWSLVLPVALLVLLTFLLSFILCFYHDGIYDQASEDYFSNLFHICTDMYDSYKDDYSNTTQPPVLKTTTVLSGYKPSSNMVKLSPDPTLGSRSHTNSPSSTINRGVHCRPSPPPYMRPRFKTEVVQNDQDSNEKNWYC